MAATPIFEEPTGLSAGPMISALSGIRMRDIKTPMQTEQLSGANTPRRLAIYDAAAGFDMMEELNYLTYRALEPNVFFNPNFLIPAIPRLKDKTVRLIVMRDEAENSSRMRFMMPYSIERPAFGTTPPVIRSWANDFGPNGTPLIDSDDPIGVLKDFFSIIGRKHLRMPQVILFPKLFTDGAAARAIRSVALENDLPLQTTNRHMRAMMQSHLDGENYLRGSVSKEHFREMARQTRRLEQFGPLEYRVVSKPSDVRMATEAFLTLEAQGWKGKARTSMLNSSLQAAFAREATYNLATKGLCRVHSIHVGGVLVASLIVFVENGVASTWKITFDEKYRKYSPGKLLMSRATEYMLDDFNILHGDSCATSNHPLMDHLWSERHEMSHLVIGLNRNADRLVRQVAGQLELYEQSRTMARTVRDQIKDVIRAAQKQIFTS